MKIYRLRLRLRLRSKLPTPADSHSDSDSDSAALQLEHSSKSSEWHIDCTKLKLRSQSKLLAKKYMAALRAVPMAYQWSWGSCRQMSGPKMSRSDPIRRNYGYWTFSLYCYLHHWTPSFLKKTHVSCWRIIWVTLLGDISDESPTLLGKLRERWPTAVPKSKLFKPASLGVKLKKLHRWKKESILCRENDTFIYFSERRM